MRRYSALVSMMPLILPAFATAQTPIEAELDVETVLVILPFSDDGDASEGTQAEPFLGEISLNGLAETVFENGVRVRGRFAARAQYDHPARPGGTGGFGDAPGAPVGAFSGLSESSALDQSDPRLRLETAYLQIDGGYGEWRLGKDLGVAARFHKGAPGVLRHARLDTSLLDPTGLATVRTRHDLTGPSLKVSYATPRLIGFRAGVSVTPEAEADGLDRRPEAGSGLSTPEMKNAVETALNGTYTFRESGVRLEGALAWSRADISDRGLIPVYQDIETVSFGSRLRTENWTFGGSWLGSDNGLADGDYEAWSLGAQRRFETFEASLSYGEARDDGFELESSSWRGGLGWNLSKNVDIGLAYVLDEIETGPVSQQSEGIVVEITLSQEILKITGN